MPDVNTVKVQIFGNDYYIKGDDNEAYIRRLAELVDQTMRDIEQRTGVASNPRLAILAALNLADSLHKSESEAKKFAESIMKKLEDVIKE